MINVQMYIPLADNDGQPFGEPHHFAFEVRAVELFGGLSRLPNTVAGAWQDAGIVYRDSLRVYVVAIASIVDGAKVGELITFAKAHYGQLAIYISYLGLSEAI